MFPCLRGPIVLANEDNLLTVAEAALVLGISERTTRRLIDQGELPAYKPTSHKTLVFREHLEAFVESHITRSENTKGG